MMLLARVGSVVARVCEEVFPFVHYAIRKRRKIRDADRDEVLTNPNFMGYQSLPEAHLAARLEEERKRAAAMDEKTYKMTLSLSIGLTVLGSSATLLLKEVAHPEVRIVLAALLGVGLFFVLSSGFIALGALRTMPTYGYGTGVLPRSSVKRAQVLADALARQETINIARHLRNEAAYQSLRNGLVVLFLAVSLFAVVFACESLSQAESFYPLRPTVSLATSLDCPNSC